MLVSDIIARVQSTLQTSGVYRGSSTILQWINDGMKLVSVLTLYDERRGSVYEAASRNEVGLPSEGSAKMLAPLYVANAVSGNRVNPVRLLDMELGSENWEGVISGEDSEKYLLFCPASALESRLFVSPMSSLGYVSLDIVGAYIPADAASADDIDFPEQYEDLLYYYATFIGFMSIPGQIEEALGMFRKFISLVNQLSRDMASRFPSDQGIKPVPVEFDKDVLNKFDMQPRSSEESRVTQEA